jgi:5'-nucleotidase (lipoprotein e(P4) family)
MRSPALLSLLVCLTLAGCAAAPPRPAPAPVAPAPAAAPAPTPAKPTKPAPGSVADDSLNAVAWTQTAIEHDLVFREIYRSATEKLLKALHDRHWDALPHDERNGAKVAHLKPAVILDIDETVLDNSAYQARLIRDHSYYNDASWAAWVKEEKARALPGALAFTKFAARHGIQVIYLSNRAKELDEYTRANLRKLGFPVHGKFAFLGLGTYVKGCEQIGTQKTCRRELVGKHYRVLMEFGDQVTDFTTVLANTVAGRRKAMEPYLDWIGQRWFVFPNPLYGSWQPALFDNSWELPLKTRRRMTEEHLRYDQ